MLALRKRFNALLERWRGRRRCRERFQRRVSLVRACAVLGPEVLDEFLDAEIVVVSRHDRTAAAAISAAWMRLRVSRQDSGNDVRQASAPG